MRKVFVLLVSLFTIGVYAQDLNTWSVEGSLGVHYIADQSAVQTDNFGHIELTLRKSLSSFFGLGLYGGFDNLDMREGNTEYERLTIEPVVHVSRLLKIDNQVFNLLAHGGPGLYRLSSAMDYRDYSQTNLALSGGVTGLFRLVDRFAIKLDWTTTINANQQRSLDLATKIANAQSNSIVNSISLGGVFYLGSHEEHSDWAHYERGPLPETIILDRTVTVTNILPAPEPSKCSCFFEENVYFRNDKDVIDIQGLNAIEKVADYLAKNKDAKVVLTGSASPTTSTSVEYDLDLSKRRVEKVWDKLLKLGVPELSMSIYYVGKDNNRENIHEFARKVGIIVK